MNAFLNGPGLTGTAIHVLIIAIIVASHCVTMAVISLSRLHTLHNRLEGFIFSLLCLSVAAWSLGPFFSPILHSYGWITALIITDVALTYILVITDRNPGKIFIPWAAVTTIITVFFLIRGDVTSSSFLIKFSIAVFPILIAMNILLYNYGTRHSSRFHLTMAIIASMMIIGGFYDTFKGSKHWLDIPASTIASFFFVLIAGFRILSGYLNRQGWADFASEMEQKEKLMQEKLVILQKSHIESVTMLSQTIEAKDQYTRGHCLRVRDFSIAIAKEMGLSQEHLHNLELAAILHDIGKIGIPGVILNKPGKLTEDEFAIIKKHPEIGARILANAEFFQPVIPVIRHHHEHYDGTGYPLGQKSADIPMESRILSVADVFDALTSDRPYRKAFSNEKSIEILQSLSGTQLDPLIVDIFLSKHIYLMQTEETPKISFDF